MRLRQLARPDPADQEGLRRRRSERLAAADQLASGLLDAEAQVGLETGLDRLNGDAQALLELLGAQNWLLTHWREASWRVNALGGFLASKQVIPAMKRAGRGNIVFVGATASRKGGPRSAAFSSAKGAQRNLAESMARALWPSGIHVALIMVDGVVDLPRTRERMPDKPDSFFIKPDDVAEIGFRLTQQRPSAWSFEVEARPYGETW